MAAERIYEKDSNTDLEPIKDEPPAVGERHLSNQESDGGPVNDQVSKCDRPAPDEDHVLCRERLQMPCVVDTFPKRLSSSDEPTIDATKIYLTITQMTTQMTTVKVVHISPAIVQTNQPRQ